MTTRAPSMLLLRAACGIDVGEQSFSKVITRWRNFRSSVIITRWRYCLSAEMITRWHYYIDAVMISRWRHCINAALVTRWQYCLSAAMITRWHYCISVKMVTGWVHWILNVSYCKELCIARKHWSTSPNRMERPLITKTGCDAAERISPIIFCYFYFAHPWLCWLLERSQIPSCPRQLHTWARLMQGWMASAGWPPQKKILATPVVEDLRGHWWYAIHRGLFICNMHSLKTLLRCLVSV